MKEHPIIFSTPMVKAILDDRKTQTRRVIKPQPDLGLDPFDSYSRINIGRYHPTMVDKDGQEYPGDEIFGAYTDDGEWGWKCPYGQVGDRLYVKETWRIVGWWEGQPYYLEYKDGTRMDEPGDSSEYDEEKYITYAQQCDDDCIKAGIKAQEDGTFIFFESEPVPTRWRPSIFMPRWASRIDLEITGIRVERLQEISPHKLATTNLEREGLRYKGRFGIDFSTQLERYVLLNEFIELWDSINGKKYPWDSNPWVWVISFKKEVG